MKVIIIGGATAGMTTASKLKRNLKDKVEIVAYQNLSYPSLGRCGIPYYIGKNFDEANIMIARTVEKFSEEGITVHTNYEITDVDFPNKTVKGINLMTKEPIEDHYDKLVIAVGGSLDKLNLPGNDAHNIYAPATLEAAVKIREELTDKIKTVVVVGGGPIGLEFCENFARNDKRVVFIEEQDQVLKDLVDPEIAEAVQMELERKSVELKLNTKVKKLHVKNKMINQIELATGELLDVDLVICALGFTPNTQFLADSEISMNPKGSIVVNDQLETNIPDVYAVGDCVLAKNIIDGSLMQIPSSTISIKQGKVLANVLTGKDDYFQGAMGTMILQIFDLEIARTGFTEEYAKKMSYLYDTITVSTKDHTAYVKGAKPVTIKVVYDTKEQIILGAQILGYHRAAMRINVFIPLIWSKTKISDVKHLDLPYSPPFSRPMDAVTIILNKLNAELE